MNFNSNNFSPETMDDKVCLAETRRKNGRLLLSDVSNFDKIKEDAIAVGNTNGKEPMETLFCFLKRQKEQLKNLEDYVASRGYTPTKDVAGLCMQVAHARNEHIEEVMDSYDADNFLSGNRAKREERRRKRRLRKGGEEGADIDTNANDDKVLVNTNSVQENAPLPPIVNPSREEAHAEIIGEEMENESYTGETKDYSIALNAAIDLGQKAAQKIKDAKASGVKLNLKNVIGLFKKAGAETASNLEKTVTQKKKKEYIKENAPMIAIVVVALVMVGVAISRN